MEKIYHEHAKVWAFKQLTLRCSSQTFLLESILTLFELVVSSQMEDMAFEDLWSGWSTPVLFQNEKRKVNNRKQQRSRSQATACGF